MRPEPDPAPVASVSERPARGRASASKAPSAHEDQPILDLLQRLKEGRADPVTFSPETRRMCVSHLGAQGYSVPEIAKVLRCSDRTITRDRRELQEASRIEHDPLLAGRIAGHLMSEVQHAMESLSRLARQRDCPHAVQAECHRARIEVLDRGIVRVQSLGFLPGGGSAGPVQSTWNAESEVPELIRLANELPETRQHVPALQTLLVIAKTARTSEGPPAPSAPSQGPLPS